MKLIIGNEYNTPHGKATYVGLFKYPFVCDSCGKRRDKVHEFCQNWNEYQQGYSGQWLHYGTECVKDVKEL